LLPTLATIVKKTKAQPHLSTMTMRLVLAIENSIKKRFSHTFDSKDAVFAALTSPKFKVKWVESQVKWMPTSRCWELESDNLNDNSSQNRIKTRRRRTFTSLIQMMKSQQKIM